MQNGYESQKHQSWDSYGKNRKRDQIAGMPSLLTESYGTINLKTANMFARINEKQ